MPIRNFKLLMRSVASVLSFFMLIYPFYSFGIEASAVGREGQRFGKDISSAFEFPTQVGNMIDFGDGEFISPNDLAPKGEGFYVDDPGIEGLGGAYDSAQSMEGIGLSAQKKLYLDASKSDPETLSGAAYQIVLRTSDARKEFPDLTNDPIVHGSGAAAFDEGLLGSFGDCSVESEVNQTNRPVRVPEPEYCTRVNMPQGGQSCTIRHEIGVFGDTVEDDFTQTGTSRASYNCSELLTVEGRAGTTLCSGSYKSFHISGNTNPYGQPICFTPQMAVFKTSSCAYTHNWTIKITTGSKKVLKITEDNWGPQECIDRALNRKAAIADIGRSNKGALFAYADPLDRTGGQFGFIKPGGTNAFSGFNSKEVNDNPYDSGFCSTTATVTAGAKNNQECINVTDNKGASHPICPGNSLYNQLKPSPIPGIPKAATEVTVDSDCKGFNEGPMDCYEDIHGVLQCPHNDGDYLDECKAFEENPSCSFVNSKCIEGARGEESGHCYAYEDEYDCGFSVDIPTYEKTDSYNCGGPIRCMGADCLDPMQPPSAADDFAKVAALLDAAESMSQDMNCNPDGSGCTVFTGEKNECKTAVGGMVNCCEKPKGISLSEYITVIRAAPKFNSAMNSLASADNPFSAVGKGYQAIAKPVGNSFNAITKPIASHVENIGGAIKGMKDTAMETIDKVATKALNTVKDAFGKGVASEAGKTASEGIVSQVMNSPAMAYLQTVMMIYTIYVVATVIVSIIWKCTKEEFELGTQRQLKSCSKVGSYCRKKVLGACIEKRQSFCCFSSPLSRIMQEQMRPQLGMNFGSAKSPDCSGIPVERFGEIDWDRVNLDEWLGILKATNNFPATSGLDIESLTGSGSNFDTGDRLNSLDRNLDRLDGADIDKARKEAAKTVPITTGKLVE